MYNALRERGVAHPPLPAGLQSQGNSQCRNHAAQVMYDALRERGITTALVMFEGEQHGFRQAANIR